MNWKYILDKWDWIMFLFIISLGVATQVPDIFPSLNIIDNKLTLIFFVLSPIPLAIGQVFHQTRNLDKSTTKLKSKIEKMDKPDTSKVLKEFDHIKQDLEADLERATRVQVLSRTGQRWCNVVLKNIKSIQKKEIQLLCLEPRTGNDGAFKMYVAQIHQLNNNTAKFEERLNVERSRHIDFLNGLKKAVVKEVRVMNYLPPYSLLMIDCPMSPINEEQCTDCCNAVIYCELASFNSPMFGKPVFKVTRDQTKWYNFFVREFKDLWIKQGKDWHENADVKQPPLSTFPEN